MHYKSTLIAAPLLVWALCAAPAQAAEQEGAATLQSEPESVSAGVDMAEAPPAKRSASGIEYMSGGVGKEERDALHLASKAYPLKMVLSAPGDDKAFVADAQVRIADASGKSVFEAEGVGPLIFVNLPGGSYTVAVTAQGQTKQQTAAVTSGQQTAMSFGFPSDGAAR
jgi:hypothetical protein